MTIPISSAMTTGIAGELVGHNPTSVSSKRSLKDNVAKVVDYLPTAVSSVAELMTGAITYNGAGTVVLTFASLGIVISVATDTDAATTRAALVAAVNANATLAALLTAADGAGGAYTLTADTPGVGFEAVASATGAGNVHTIAPTTGNIDSSYSLTIGGATVSYRADASATVAEIRAGLIAAVEANVVANALVSAAASGDNVRLTERTPANGEVAISSAVTGPAAALAATVITAHGHAETLEPGIVVVRSGTSNPYDVALPRGALTDPEGIVLWKQRALEDYGSASDAIWDAGEMVPVCAKGDVRVKVDGAVTRGGDVYVRHTVNGARNRLGALRGDNDGGTAALLAGAEWVETASADGLAVVRINLPS